MSEKRWLALESNPEVLSQFIEGLGVKGWSFADVYGTDPDLLQMVPQPVIAVLLLRPITAKSEAASAVEQERIERDGQSVPPSTWFVKQTIGNACGTIGVLHSLANNADRLQPAPGSPIAQFLDETRHLTPTERAERLETSTAIAAASEQTANEGQTETPSLDADINLHFISFVEKDGQLLELDGRKSAPINHGPTSADTLLEDSVNVIKRFMEQDPDEVNFSMMALVKTPPD